MIRKSHLLFCDNDHGTGDVTFPDLKSLDAYDTQQQFVVGNTVRTLRADAKQCGWGRVGGADYCPNCMESM